MFFFKSQATILNLLLFLLILAFVFYRLHKRKAFLLFLYATLILFLLCATNYLPCYLARQLEKQYLPLDVKANPSLVKTKILIHVLGSGYSTDKSLPANTQLGQCAMSRLAEGIRLYRLLDSSIIVGSGNGLPGAETQAEVTIRAAILLGIDPGRTGVLTTPSTTQEEVKALASQFGSTSKVIVVTDAIHMPRAIKLFKAAGFQPIASPTNFKTHEIENTQVVRWLPAMENISLMNIVLHEYLGGIKAAL